MKRAAYTFAIVSVLLFGDGFYLEVSNNQAGCGCNGDSGSLFGGSTNIALSTGTEVLIGAGFLLVVAIIIWIVATLRARGQPFAATGAAGRAQGGQGQGRQAQVGVAQAAKAQPGQAQAAMAPAGGSQAKREVTAGQGQPRKESGDQH